MTKHAKIAITIPPQDLRAADKLAAKLDRSRSWVVAEAVRRFVAEAAAGGAAAAAGGGETLDASRRAQLRRDLTLDATERVREAEDVYTVPRAARVTAIAPRRFASYDEFAAWRARGG